jgi:hypothetical protein
MPIAIVATRWSTSYELVQAAFAIPVAVALGLVALSLASGRSGIAELDPTRRGGARVARLGRVLAAVGLGLAASATISIAVYGILTYLGNRS